MGLFKQGHGFLHNMKFGSNCTHHSVSQYPDIVITDIRCIV